MSFIKKPIVILGGIIVLLLFIGAVTGSKEKKAEQGTVSVSPTPTEVKTETTQASIEPIVSSSPSSAPTTPAVSPTPAKSSQTPSVKASAKTEVVQSPNGSCKYSCNSPDRDCKDFSSQGEAQAFFNCCGFSASNDPMRLDKTTGTGNGKACESLP